MENASNNCASSSQAVAPNLGRSWAGSFPDEHGNAIQSILDLPLADTLSSMTCDEQDFSSPSNGANDGYWLRRPDMATSDTSEPLEISEPQPTQA